MRILTEREYFTAHDMSIFCFNLYNVRALRLEDYPKMVDTSTPCAKIIGAIIFVFMGFHVFFAGCGFWIIAKLRGNGAQLSERTRQLQLQFVYLLLLQVRPCVIAYSAVVAFSMAWNLWRVRHNVRSLYFCEDRNLFHTKHLESVA